ncbi:alpha-(1,3)-fucosyltransferase 10 [Procambarus clarkii]|uniref:alpha-(1,3)-fucosyltransferase 10 n=1 Tax=Procambarus clarkii TaxID=6728 RepID=UPI00374231D4
MYFSYLAAMELRWVVFTAQVVVMASMGWKEARGSHHGSWDDGGGPPLPGVTDLPPLPPASRDAALPPASRDASLSHPPRYSDPTAGDAARTSASDTADITVRAVASSISRDIVVSTNDADPMYADLSSKDADTPATDAGPSVTDDGTPPEDKGESTVLWWTPFTGVGSGQSRTCHLGSCFFTEDRGAYLHHPRTEAVLFYGSDFSVEDLPLPRRSPHQWWGLLHEESPKNQPLFDHQQVLELFNLTATFRRESDFPLTLQHLESMESLTSGSEFVVTSVKTQLMAEEDLAPVVYVQSDCDTPSERDAYVQQLSKYIKIDSYGSCLHNRDLPPHLHDPADTFDHVDFRAIVAKYKFTLAIENAACDDYITEKLWRPLTLGSVPVYWGSPSVKDWEPNPRSVIPVTEFESPQQLAWYLYKLMENETLYESHLKHKLKQKVDNLNLVRAMAHRKWGINNDFDKGNFIEHFECFVCDSVLSRRSKAEHTGGEVMASLNHYGCPEPPNVLTGKPNPKSFWVEQWHKARVEAKVLSRLVKTNKKFFPDVFYQNVIDELQKDGFFVHFPPDHLEL